jgi:hypothetical protein
MKLHEATEEVSRRIEPWQAQRENMRLRCVAWLQSSAFRGAFYNDAHIPPALKEIIDARNAPQKAAETWKKMQIFGIQSNALWDQYQQLAQRGQIVFAQSVIVGPEFDKAPNESLPSVVLVPDEQDSINLTFGGLLASAVGALYATGAEAEDHPQILRLIKDDQFQLFRRRPLPPEETSGVRAQLFDLQMRKSWMPPEDVLFIPLLMLPGSGAVLQVPWSIATGATPAPDTMKDGKWTELTLSPATPPPVSNAAAGANPKTGCSPKALLITAAVLACFGMVIWDGLQQKPVELNLNKPVHWAQPAELKQQITVVFADKYEPLTREGKQSPGFLFFAKPGVYLAATNRHPSGGADTPPKSFQGLDDLTVTLDPNQIVLQPESQIQAVTAVSKPTTCLTFDAADKVAIGDELWLLQSSGKHITGRVSSFRAHDLTEDPMTMQMAVADPIADAASLRGSPIVRASTGHVVGVVQAATKSGSPKAIEFETLHLPESR